MKNIVFLPFSLLLIIFNLLYFDIKSSKDYLDNNSIFNKLRSIKSDKDFILDLDDIIHKSKTLDEYVYLPNYVKDSILLFYHHLSFLHSLDHLNLLNNNNLKSSSKSILLLKSYFLEFFNLILSNINAYKSITEFNQSLLNSLDILNHYNKNIDNAICKITQINSNTLLVYSPLLLNDLISNKSFSVIFNNVISKIENIDLLLFKIKREDLGEDTVVIIDQLEKSLESDINKFIISSNVNLSFSIKNTSLNNV